MNHVIFHDFCKLPLCYTIANILLNFIHRKNVKRIFHYTWSKWKIHVCDQKWNISTNLRKLLPSGNAFSAFKSHNIYGNINWYRYGTVTVYYQVKEGLNVSFLIHQRIKEMFSANFKVYESTLNEKSMYLVCLTTLLVRKIFL